MPRLDTQEIYRTVLESLQTGVYVLDLEGKILLWNQGAARITGYMQHEVLGRFCRDNILAQCDHIGCVTCAGQCPFGRVLQDGHAREYRIQLRHRRGHPISVLMRVVPIRDPGGSVIGIAHSFDEQRFAMDRDRNQYNLASSGCLDETDVPNREYLQFRLREDLSAFTEYHLPFGIIFVEVDGLARFRTVYGHEAGGAILRVVAQTIRNGLRPADFLGRWSEEQFLAVLPNCGWSGVQRAGDRIRKLAGYAKLQWWGDQLSVTTSIGYASAQTGDSMDSLVQRAQQTMAKTSGTDANGHTTGHGVQSNKS